jgi:hypothetical protein
LNFPMLVLNVATGFGIARGPGRHPPTCQHGRRGAAARSLLNLVFVRRIPARIAEGVYEPEDSGGF